MTPSQPSPTNLSDELDKLIKDYGIGLVVCAACKHDVYSHYWNGAGNGENSGWDSCHAKDCSCKGEWSEPESNTIDSCGWLKREFVPDANFKTAITAAYAEAIRSTVPEKRKMDSPNGGDMCPYCYEDVEGGLTPFNDGFNRAISTFTANLQKEGLL